MKGFSGYDGLSPFALVSLFYALGFGLVLFLLPFLAYDISPNVFVVGVLVAAPALVSMLAAIPAGSLTDFYGVRVTFIASLVAMIVLVLCLPYVSTAVGFLIFACFFGFFYQLVYTSLKAHLFDISPQGRTSKYFSIFLTTFQIGLSLGPIVGGYLILDSLSIGLSAASKFFALDCLGLLFLILVFKIGAGVKKKTDVTQYNIRHFFINSMKEYLKLRRIGAVVLLLTILFTTYEGLVWAFEPLFNKYYSLNTFTTGMLLSMFTLPFIVFSIPAGILADRYGKIKILVPGLLVTGLFIIIFGFVENPILLILSAVISSIGLAFAWSSMAGLLADASTKFEKGCIVGVWNMSEGLGYLIGPVLGGLIAEYSSIKIPFIMIGFVMMLSILPVLLANRK